MPGIFCIYRYVFINDMQCDEFCRQQLAVVAVKLGLSRGGTALLFVLFGWYRALCLYCCCGTTLLLAVVMVF